MPQTHLKFPSLAACFVTLSITASLFLLAGYQHGDSETFPGTGVSFARAYSADVFSAKEKAWTRHGRELLGSQADAGNLLKADVFSAKEKARTRHGRKLLGSQGEAGNLPKLALKITFGFVGILLFALLACLGISCCLRPLDDSTRPIAPNQGLTSSASS